MTVDALKRKGRQTIATHELLEEHDTAPNSQAFEAGPGSQERHILSHMSVCRSMKALRTGTDLSSMQFEARQAREVLSCECVLEHDRRANLEVFVLKCWATAILPTKS